MALSFAGGEECAYGARNSSVNAGLGDRLSGEIEGLVDKSCLRRMVIENFLPPYQNPENPYPNSLCGGPTTSSSPVLPRGREPDSFWPLCSPSCALPRLSSGILSCSSRSL